MARDNYIELGDRKASKAMTGSSSKPAATRPDADQRYFDSPRDTKAATTLTDSQLEVTANRSPLREEIAQQLDSPAYRVYKRRFLGLAQLVLLNIIVSWDWLTFAAVSDTSAEYFRVSNSAINWLSTGFLFAFVVAAPATIWVLNHHGPKVSILVASALVLAGNWIRYAGTRANHGYFGVVMFGQILIGLAQPFVLAAPTRYSNMWFSDEGRVAATAVASLANPFGGALGQLIGPFWATSTSGIPSMVLYTSILSTVATIPALFTPARPSSPPSAVGAAEKLDLKQAFQELPKNGSFFLLLLPFSVYVGFFNATSSLINQIFEPYGFSEDDAGIAGAILIVVGLIASAIVSPVIDRTKAYLLTIKILVPLIAISYTILIFMPQTRNLGGPYVVCALLGATSFSLLPAALELLSIVTFPVSPEVSSVIAWTGGQILGAVFIIIMDALRGGWAGEPFDSMIPPLIFQAVIAWAAVPFPLLLGVWKFKKIIISHDAPMQSAMRP
ncbi:Putative major facilitator superfamily, MFS transporter superfamily [Septoria linicola]|uniref:Major facilitator superfamily, MFS transporter superfamily n=1 Tax=Septoria linicola TaxID=215465 RepID=A0A9Q9EI82_9PEZI|nr:putative major facilitator superfamily, MFS transporter superfamily [Septoria linicola]USW52546.1 Putative major facilitator superfamily, MFS transporter superfamily [Septoria linicola]